MLQVDAGADHVAKQCRNLIAKYKEDLHKSGLNQSAHEHHLSVCSGLDTFLQSVVSFHSEMRAVRASKHLEMKKLSRLEVTSVESRAREIGPGQASSTLSQQVRLIFIFATFKVQFLSTFNGEF